MPTDISATSAVVSESFQKLQSSASILNAVSDELGKAIAQIDDGLRKLNLGITTWVQLRGGDGRHYGRDDFWHEDVGYSKINGKWGISLRKLSGDYTDPDSEYQESWLFADAPRELRIQAIDQLPALFQKLSAEANKVTMEVKAKLPNVAAFASVVNPPVTKPSLKAAMNATAGILGGGK